MKAKHNLDLLFIKKLEAFENRLPDDLALRERAIKNWKKLRLLVVLLMVCGKNADKSGTEITRIYEEEPEKFSLKEKIAPYIINPRNKYKILWDSMMGFLYWMTFFLDPYIFAFLFVPLENRNINFFQKSLTFVIFLDMILEIFTGIPREDSQIIAQPEPTDDDKSAKTGNSGKQDKEKRKGNVKSLLQKVGNDNSIDDPALNRDIGFLFKSYLRRDAIWDMAANFPVIIYLARNNALWESF